MHDLIDGASTFGKDLGGKIEMVDCLIAIVLYQPSKIRDAHINRRQMANSSKYENEKTR